MKTKVLVATMLLAGMAASAQAGVISGSKHDLSNTNTGGNSFHGTAQNQICIFCHTPHNAVTNKLLWNRNAQDASAFKIFTSYNRNVFKGAGNLSSVTVLQSDSSSLLCLSCHGLDSLAAIMTETANNGNLADAAGAGAGRDSKGRTWGAAAGSAKLGKNLTNTHPIGISYSQALLADVVDGSAAAFQAMGTNGGTVDVTNGAKIRFFGQTNILECASCHAVHDAAYSPFLAADNTGSKLCLACHIK